MNIPEKYLRHIWKNVYLNLQTLATTDGKPVQIISVGTLNRNEGADFLNAKLRIDGIEKDGSVEIHRRTSEWNAHHHADNTHYEKVILHAVFEHDAYHEQPIPTLELSKHLSLPLPQVLAMCMRDESALETKSALPCASMVQTVSDDLKLEWLETLSRERFMNKVKRFDEHLLEITTHTTKYDELIYAGLCRALGYSENTAPMLALAKQFSFDRLKNLATLGFTERRAALESVFFSASGLMEETNDDETKRYQATLHEKFPVAFIGSTSGSASLNKNEWVFFRLRPSNFPTVRLAGLCEVLSKNLERGFMSTAFDIVQMSVPDKRKLTLLESVFTADASGYWETHYRFGTAAKEPLKQLIGKNRASEIVINTLLPVLYLSAEHGKNEKLKSQVLSLYNAYPKGLTSEVAVQTLRDVLGDAYSVKSAAFEQGLLELKKNYCDTLRCLECAIGNAILTR
jgi:hypothetical protein